jgi:hypothetical protein
MSALEEFMIDTVLPLSYVLFGVAVLLAIGLGVVMSVLSNPSGMIRSVIAFALLGVVFIISYSIAGDEVKPFYQEFGVTDPSTSKMIGGGLIMFYILLAIALVGIVFTEVSKFFK